jgi:AP-1 complex subunit mu
MLLQELEEESLRDNFVIVYELLDEVMDFGYPQFTEAKILSEWVLPAAAATSN